MTTKKKNTSTMEILYMRTEIGKLTKLSHLVFQETPISNIGTTCARL